MISNKALVEVTVPASGEKFDVFIPLESRMSEVAKLVASAISDLSEGKYRATADAILCDAETGSLYDVNKEIAELGIQNGSRLLLI